jgi:hypothetical protein
MIEDDLSRIKKSATKSTYKLGIECERCEDKIEKSASKFIPTFNYHNEEEALKPTKTHYPSNPKPSFNPKREVKRESPKPRVEAFVCIFCGRVGHLDEFCFWHKRIEKRRFDYARNSYRGEFIILRLDLVLMLCLALSLVLYLSSLMDLTITHMVLIHERIALCLDTLDMIHVLIVVIISCVGLVFPQEGFTPVLSRDTWTIHIFPIMVLVPLV